MTIALFCMLGILTISEASVTCSGSHTLLIVEKTKIPKLYGNCESELNFSDFLLYYIKINGFGYSDHKNAVFLQTT